MKNRASSAGAVLALLTFLAAAGFGSQALAATARRPGTSIVCEGSLDQAIKAVTNAFSSWRYHDMLFVPLSSHYDVAMKRSVSKPATHEWTIETADLPGTSQILVTWNKAMVPYSARFLITAEQLVTNQVVVTVTTSSASIPDGREIGLHGGWAVHMKHIAPVPEQETNVLSRIQSQLRSIQAGRLEPLPATSDTTETLKGPIKLDLELHPQAKEELLGAIQAETNAALRGELMKMLILATNGVNGSAHSLAHFGN
jgi:hypothetical protein